jgi:hypothetical protein
VLLDVAAGGVDVEAVAHRSSSRGNQGPSGACGDETHHPKNDEPRQHRVGRSDHRSQGHDPGSTVASSGCSGASGRSRNLTWARLIGRFSRTPRVSFR